MANRREEGAVPEEVEIIFRARFPNDRRAPWKLLLLVIALVAAAAIAIFSPELFHEVARLVELLLAAL